jgi:hypothetical protein
VSAPALLGTRAWGSRCPWWCRIGCAARDPARSWCTSGRSVAAPSADHAPRNGQARGCARSFGHPQARRTRVGRLGRRTFPTTGSAASTCLRHRLRHRTICRQGRRRREHHRKHVVGAGRVCHDPRVHPAWSPHLIDPAHHDPVAALHAALPRRRDDRQPLTGPVHHRAISPGARTSTTHADTLERPNHRPSISASASMRRAASTSRTSGRFAVGPAGRSWTPTPIPARHEEAEELK